VAAARLGQQNTQAAPAPGCELRFETPLPPELSHVPVFDSGKTGSGNPHLLLDPAKHLLRRNSTALGLSLPTCKMGLERCSRGFYSLF